MAGQATGKAKDVGHEAQERAGQAFEGTAQAIGQGYGTAAGVAEQAKEETSEMAHAAYDKTTGTAQDLGHGAQARAGQAYDKAAEQGAGHWWQPGAATTSLWRWRAGCGRGGGNVNSCMHGLAWWPWE